MEYEHSTRFKEKILKRIPGLTERKMGRDVILTLKENCVKAIFKACDLQDNYGEYQARSACQNNMKTLSGRTKQWCAFSEEIRNIVSVNKFKETIISFIRPKEKSVFAVHDIKGLKLLTRLRLNCSHLNEHKFRHGFKDTIDPMCKCGVETETTLHFLLRCRLYSNIGTELLDDIYTVDSSLTNYPDEKLLNILLYGSEYFSVKTNQSNLKSTIKLLKSSERFDNPLFS